MPRLSVTVSSTTEAGALSPRRAAGARGAREDDRCARGLGREEHDARARGPLHTGARVSWVGVAVPPSRWGC